MPAFTSSIEADEGISNKVSIYRDAVIEEASQTEFMDPEPPPPGNNMNGMIHYSDDGMPILPSDIVSLTSDQVGQLFSIVEGWYNYLNTLCTEADLRATAAREVRDLVKAYVRKEMKTAGAGEKERAEFYPMDDRYIEANAKYLTADAYYQRLEAVRKVFSKKFQLVSREISRRNGDHGFGDVDDRFGSRSRYNSGGRYGVESGGGDDGEEKAAGTVRRLR